MLLRRPHLAKDLAKELGISQREAKYIYSVAMERLVDFIVEGNDVAIQNLGTFRRKEVQPRRFYDINTNERKHSEGRMGITFLPSKTLIKKMNEK
jgi:nucleoid DNA-binding protein